MKRKKLLSSFLLPVVLILTISSSTANTVSVDNALSLISELSGLENGDTLKIASGTYNITPDIAVDGLLITTADWTMYKDVTIIGAGMDATVIDFNGSYGFYAYYSDNLLIKDLTITNASKNGGIYVQDGEMNLENVKIDACESTLSDTKTEAHGGAVYYDVTSKFSYIKGCVFSNNSAEGKGGAIAVMNVAKSTSLESYIENCQFYGNTSSEGGSALHLQQIYSKFFVNNNIFCQNTIMPAIYVNATNNVSAQLSLKNNSIALNSKGGLTVASGLRSYLFLNNNAIVDNGVFDVALSYSGTKYTGNFNVIRDVPTNRDNGYFNELLTTNNALFKVENDTLVHTAFAVDYLAGRVPASLKSDKDIYGNVCLSPADIGAVNIDQGNSVAIWTGAEDQDFFNANNWRGEVYPTVSDNSNLETIIISNCDLSNYPMVSETVTLVNGGDVSLADVRITPTGILDNKGIISVDTLYVESQNGGTAQLLNSGTINNNKRFTEAYFSAQKWTPIYIPDAGLTADALFVGAAYGTAYEVKKYDEASGLFEAVPATEVFDKTQGYMVKSKLVAKAFFQTPDNYNESFSVQHTEKADTLSSGWNLIANPYGVAIETEKLLKNTGNENAAAGALYTYDGSRYKVWVDGIGDEEASVIAPREAFFVQALDADKSTTPSSVNFTTDLDNSLLIPNEVLKSTEVQREGLLTIGLASSGNTTYDKAYLRFMNDAEATYDYSYDAMKMARINGGTSSLIYTMNDENTKFAVNAQSIASDAVMSIPVKLDFAKSTITSSKSYKLNFALSGGDSISYLLHDALQDSSKAVELTDGKVISFRTGTDSLSLLNRYSLQVFDGEIPNGVAATSIATQTIVESISRRDDYLYERDTVSFVNKVDTIWGADTLVALAYMVDSFYVYTISTTAVYTDSIYFDSTFVTTTKLWGTYGSVELDTLTKSHFERTRTYEDSDTSKIPTVYFNNYIAYDTIVVTGLEDMSADVNRVSVYGGSRCVHIASESSARMNVSVYDLTGKMVKQERLNAGMGRLELSQYGVFIVRIEQDGAVSSSKVLVNN